MKLCELFDDKYYRRKWKKERRKAREEHPEIGWKVSAPVGIPTSHSPAAGDYNG